MFFFFFQAEDGIRDADVTGVQTCALPICRRRDLAPATPGGEAAIVRDLRNRFVTWASVCGSLVVIDVATGSHLPGWSLIVAGIWAGAALVPRYVRLWHAGDSRRDVLAPPPPPGAIAVRFGATAGGGGKVGARPP